MFIRYLLLTMLCLSLFSCSDEKEQAEPVAKSNLIVLFSPGGLGDRGYNDLILQGLQKIRKERSDVSVLFYSPSAMEEAETIFGDWLRKPANGNRSLFVLATSDYAAMTRRLLQAHPQTDHNKQILLFEADKVEDLPLHSFRISMYGASFLAGATAALCPGDKALVVLGNGEDPTIVHAAEGFSEGYAVGGKQASTTSLANDWHGFVMEAEAYRKMYEWGKEYSFVYPVAGGSNMGIYRYIREYPSGIYTAGMDVDQSNQSSQVIGSMVKHIDKLTEFYILEWLDKNKLPDEHLYGLESGYVDWQLSPEYQAAFEEDVNKMRNTAINKEKKYYEKTE